MLTKNTRASHLCASIILLWGMLTIAACKPHSLGPRPYAEYAANPKNGLVMQKKIGSVTYDLKVQTPQVVLAEYYKRGMTDISPDSMSNSVNFLFKISAQPDEQYKLRLLQDNVFLADVASRITVSEGGVELKQAFSIPENYYGVSNTAVINLGYVRSRELRKYEELVFTYNDEAMGSGNVNFTIPAKVLNELPALKL